MDWGAQIVMWPTMNLMLVNLLIAMMNDTVCAYPRNSKPQIPNS